MTVTINVPVALQHKILKLHPHATVVVGGHDTMENLLNTASHNLEQVTDKQNNLQIKNNQRFCLNNATDGRKHVWGGIRKKKKKNL